MIQDFATVVIYHGGNRCILHLDDYEISDALWCYQVVYQEGALKHLIATLSTENDIHILINGFPTTFSRKPTRNCMEVIRKW